MAAVILSPDAAQAEVESIVKRAGTSFYQGMKILPPARRNAMWGIYAFCRLVDDVADEPAPAAEKQAGLDEWRRRIGRLYAGEPLDPVTQVLLPFISEYHLREVDFLAVIDGMQMDAFEEIVAPSFEKLDLYCDRVAAAVGRLSVRAFGDASPRADDVAWALGRALQFTNILRDLAEDAERNRLYLPAEWLAEAGITITTPTAMLQHPAMKQVCERMAQQAHRYFDAAHAAMRQCDQKAMRPARLMGATYGAILTALEKRGWEKFSQPVKLSKLHKLWLVARYGLA